MFKQIALAALAAAWMTGSIGVAHAESNISGSDPASSAGMQLDMRDKMGAAGFAAAPSTNTNAYGYAPGYGYAPERRPAPSHHVRSSATTNHHG